jgi:two-component system LytT family response regulator
MLPSQASMRTLIIDDDLHACCYLRELPGGETDVDAVVEGSSGTEGLELTRTLSIDRVFMDIQTPGLDGFELVDQVATERTPVFIFVTGYSEYAVKAFDVEAVIISVSRLKKIGC